MNSEQRFFSTIATAAVFICAMICITYYHVEKLKQSAELEGQVIHIEEEKTRPRKLWEKEKE